MDDNFDDIFDRKDEGISETATEETIPVETVETVETPEANTEETTPETPATEPTGEDQPRDEKDQPAERRNWVPVEALRAERQKAQAEAQRAAEIEQRLREYEDKQRQTTRPDPFENPEDYDQYVAERVETLVEQKLREREEQRHRELQAQQAEELFKPFQNSFATHGPDKVQEALEYAGARAEVDDAWGHAMLRSADPVAAILEEKNRHAQQEAEWAEYSRDPQGFIARKAAALSAAGAAIAPATQPQMAATAKAPRSLASAGGGIAATPTVQTTSEAFDAIFDSK